MLKISSALQKSNSQHKQKQWQQSELTALNEIHLQQNMYTFSQLYYDLNNQSWATHHICIWPTL